MQSTRLLLTTQNYLSTWRVNYLLRRCIRITNSIHIDTKNSNLNNRCLSLLDLNRNGRLLSISKYNIFPIRYASSGSLPSHKKITLPALSPTMETGTLRSWAKQEGEKVSEGDILAEIETDKATLGFEAGDEGYLAKIVLPAGSKDVPVGKLCAIIVEKEEDIAAFKDYKDDGSAAAQTSGDEQPAKSEKKEKEPPKKEEPPPPTTTTAKTEQQPTTTATKEKKTTAPSTSSSSTKDGRAVASPFAKKLAKEKGIDLQSVQGTGPNGRIIAEDVEKFIKEGGAKAKVDAKKGKDEQITSSKQATPRTITFDEQQVSQLRAENARRVAESKSTIPHYYLTIEVEIDELLKLRQKLNELTTSKSKDKSTGITMNDFIIKAAALACKKRPETNSIWMEKSIRQYETIDFNIAINTDAGVVMTPILYNVDQKGLSAINKELSQLTEKANGGQLSDNEVEMGTFTISNLGMYGVTNFSAVIYPQQSAILAVGSIENRILPAPDSQKGYRQSSVLNITLACDHRVIDGAVGAQWLQEFKQYLESPGSMIL